MAGHSILYLGRGDFARVYLSELESLPCCTMLRRSADMRVPDDVAEVTDVILLDVEPGTVDAIKSLSELLQWFNRYPVVALTVKEHEHRGIAAVRAGAEGYICIDDITVEGQNAVLDSAVRRFELRRRLSDSDVSVLSILSSINDGVIVVDARGHVLDINPAGRSILALGPRAQLEPGFEQTFCCLDANGNNYRNSADLPLVRARSGEKFSNQVAIYRAPEQPEPAARFVLACSDQAGRGDAIGAGGDHESLGVWVDHLSSPGRC